jgi:hypothetical protein
MQLVHILEALAIALAEYISLDMEARTTLSYSRSSASPSDGPH